ncbi:MAG: glycosyltransferase WbuB [Ignavibacteriae bacterium]|nr:MAG: glycosyltransferase WbuB [Ignavibacteriota bacterium]
MKNRLIIVTEFFFPDQNATGYLLTRVAEGFVDIADVHVLCKKQKNYTMHPGGVSSSPPGMVTDRIPSTSFNKNILLLRLINILTLSISFLLRLVWILREGDQVLVVTNPPSLPFIAAIACRWKKARYSILVHDVYPDVLIATGVLRDKHVLARGLRWMSKKLLESSESIIVLGRDMAKLLGATYCTINNRMTIIPNWGDVNHIIPEQRPGNSILAECSLENKFVVQYVGNIGRTHNIELLVECAEILKEQEDIHFLCIGDGAKKRWLSDSIAQKGLRNVSMRSFYPRSRQSEVHNACDLVVISFIPGMAGISVPSRMYNVMAAGKPIIGVTDTHSELAMVIQEENIGWVVSSYRAQDVVDVILSAKAAMNTLVDMGLRARKTAEEKYTFEKVIPLYRNVLFNNMKE